MLHRRQRPIEPVFRADGVALLESHHAPGFSMDWRRDAFAKIILVVGGEGSLHGYKGEERLHAPCLCLVPPDVRHRFSDRAGKPLSLYGICLRHETFPEPDLLEQACARPRCEEARPLVHRMLATMQELLIEERDPRPESRACQRGLINRILVELIRAAPSRHASRMTSQQRVARYIDQLDRTFWRVEDLDGAAAAVGLSRRRFTQLFRQQTGHSWHKAVTRLRMEHARTLVRDTHLSIEAIAFECGYRDLAHFYRAFRAYHGTPPGQLRT